MRESFTILNPGYQHQVPTDLAREEGVEDVRAGQRPCGEDQSPSWLEPGTGLIEVGYRGKKAHVQALI